MGFVLQQYPGRLLVTTREIGEFDGDGTKGPWSDDVEGLFSRWRVRQQGKNLVDFVKRSWPSMYENQGDGIFMGRSLMYEMNRHFSKVIHVNGKRELRQFIDF